MFQFDTKSEDYANLQKMLEHTQKEGEEPGQWGIDPNTLMDYMTRIGFHETGGTLDPTQEQINGKPGQEGMGLFQYEKGEHEGAHTAINRLTRWYEEHGWGEPEFLDNVGQDFDVSTLTPSQQYQLFIADKAYDETASFKGVDTPEELKQQWAKEHWAGPENKLQDRLSSFDDSMGLYKDTLLDKLMPKNELEG